MAPPPLGFTLHFTLSSRKRKRLVSFKAPDLCWFSRISHVFTHFLRSQFFALVKRSPWAPTDEILLVVVVVVSTLSYKTAIQTKPNQNKTNSCAPPSFPCTTCENGEEPVTNKKDQEKLLPYATALHISRKPKVWRITVDTTEKVGGRKNNGDNQNAEDYTKYYYRDRKTFRKKKKTNRKIHNYTCKSHKRLHQDFKYSRTQNIKIGTTPLTQ